jgi:hypothetical protein
MLGQIVVEGLVNGFDAELDRKRGGYLDAILKDEQHT